MMARDWPAMKWSLESFAKLGGNQRDVVIQTRRESSVDFEINNGYHTQAMKFPAFLKMMEHGEHTNDFYMTARNATANEWLVKKLVKDVPSVDGSTPRNLFTWIGPGGTVTPWHHDECDVIFGQLTGYKQVWVVEGKHSDRMRRNKNVKWFSDWGDALRPGPETSLRPPAMFALLGPGDGMFLPRGTWHRVESLSSSISASWCM
jgi:mannose-6-phosphate isomerase-like protein (cupin superfamily)